MFPRSLPKMLYMYRRVAEEEFRALMKENGLCYELTEASGLKVQDLEDLFLCLSNLDGKGKR